LSLNQTWQTFELIIFGDKNNDKKEKAMSVLQLNYYLIANRKEKINGNLNFTGLAFRKKGN
jgi:hypothetical protein